MSGDTELTRGQAYKARLDDGREVYIDGRRVASVADSPEFGNAVNSIARMYDAIDDVSERDVLSITLPGGRRVSRAWDLPQDQQGLRAKREALLRLSELNYGWLGRSPEHLACTLGAMAMGYRILAEHDAERAKAVADYFHFAREKDLYATYTIVNPQADKSKAACDFDDGLIATIVDEDSEGITIRGAKMLGTGTAIADELMVGNIQPMRPEEAKQAFTCAIPLSAPGLNLLSRRSYEAAATSEFDYPLSSHFDENDALVYFDNVKVPWHRVFSAGDTALGFKLFHAAPTQLMMGYQGIVRLTTKLHFLLGLFHQICEMNGVLTVPQVQQDLGELAAHAVMVESMVEAMEARGEVVDGYFLPHRATVQAARVLCQSYYPEFVTRLRRLAGGGLIMLPSSVADFADPELARIIGLTQHSVTGGPEDRVKLMKLAWDATGSEFGSRHVQYEMFYSGALFVAQTNTFRSFDWPKGRTLAQDFTQRFQKGPRQ